MNDLEEIEIQILTAEDAYCQIRIQGNRHFCWDEPNVCPFKKRLKADFLRYLADRQRKHDKYERPDET